MGATARRVVTGVDDEGRSCVVSDGPAPVAGGFVELWATDGPVEQPLPPGALAEAIEPPPGGTWWRLFTIPPVAEMRERLAGATVPGIDRDGFHTTATVDYVTVLEGEVTLVLDRAQIALRAGDCVIQRGTRHAWRNHGDVPVRMMAMMLSARAPR
jgi:mannose-6-phosphate isomerase-like protein (cupin superfamily)